MSDVRIFKNNNSSPFGAGGLRVGIIGGAGYTGGELIRLLTNHSSAEISFVHSKSNTGKYIYEIHKDLIGETDLKFSSSLGEVDVLFLCLGHGDSKKFLNENSISEQTKIIDLSNDFRLSHNSQLTTRSFIYGLPELNKEQIRTAQNIANPGCFATAIQLALLPLAKAGLLSDVYTTGITGSTGAGQGLSNTSHFSWRENNIQAYKTLTHQHVDEIMQSLNQVAALASSTLDSTVQAGVGVKSLNFIPWRGDFTRGIYISSTVDCNLSLNEVQQLYREFYADQPFTILSETMIDLKQAVNTNKCLIHLEKQGNKLVIHSTLDNLLKGASGQAVQNMNLMFGLNETEGLKLKATAF